MRNILLLVFLCIAEAIAAQKLNEADSLLRRKYYQRIFPKAINSKSDILYEGIDNLLDIQFPDETSRTFRYLLKTHNGMIFKADNMYITIPRNAGRAFISTYVITETDTVLFGKKEFAVQRVPLPSLKIGNTVIRDQSVIDKNIFLKSDSLKVFFTDDIENSENWCHVEYFIIGYSFGGKYISFDNKGDLLTATTKEFIMNLKPNEDVVIKVSNMDCSLIYKTLPLVRFKIN